MTKKQGINYRVKHAQNGHITLCVDCVRSIRYEEHPSPECYQFSQCIDLKTRIYGELISKCGLCGISVEAANDVEKELTTSFVERTISKEGKRL